MQRLKDIFRAQSIVVPDEVITILYHDASAAGGTSHQVEQRALELWKCSDLRSLYTNDVSRAGAPLGRLVKTNAKIVTVSESLCLQIDYLRDVSRPAYQQLQKAINRFGENVLVNADTPNEPAGKLAENGKRMLLINLTDGVHDIRAMEYQFIHQLSTATPPGTKVRLIPPIMSQRGLLLLKPGNIHVIGGHAVNLADQYAQKRVLATTLNADLEALEKAAPPCLPPNAAPPLPGAPQAVQQPQPMNAVMDDGFDAEGDALLAGIPDEWGVDPDGDDEFLGEALDQFDAENH